MTDNTTKRLSRRQRKILSSVPAGTFRTRDVLEMLYTKADADALRTSVSRSLRSLVSRGILEDDTRLGQYRLTEAGRVVASL